MKVVAVAAALAGVLLAGCGVEDDPVPTLQALQTPALWLLGTADRSIPIETTLTNLKALAASGKPFAWRTYDGLGHGLSPAIWDDVKS